MRFDGSLVADVLNRHKSTQPLSRKLLRVRDLSSVNWDFERASSALEALKDTLPKDYKGTHKIELDKTSSTLQGALAQQAVILYARATDTDSKSRSKFDASKHYDDKQKQWHRMIINARNSVVAHFGPGSHGGRPWHIDKLFIDYDRNTSELIISTNPIHYNYRGDVIGALARLLPVAREGLKHDSSKAFESLFREISLHREEFNQALRACGTIPVVEPETATWTPMPFE